MKLATMLPWLLSLVCLAAANWLIPTVLPKLPGVTGKFFTWVKTKAATVKNTYVQGLLLRATDLIQTVVLKFEQVEVAQLQADAAAGKLTPDQLKAEYAKLKANAVAAVKDHMTLQGILNDVLHVAFSGNETGMTKWIEDAIEAAVAQLTTSKP